jgi:hypothetical protein
MILDFAVVGFGNILELLYSKYIYVNIYGRRVEKMNLFVVLALSDTTRPIKIGQFTYSI